MDQQPNSASNRQHDLMNGPGIEPLQLAGNENVADLIDDVYARSGFNARTLAEAAQLYAHMLAENTERNQRLWRAILELPAQQRDIIVMSHFQDMRYREIAELLEIPIGTVMSRLHNARKALKKALGGDEP